MAELLATDKTISCVKQIIREAKQRLVIVTFSIQINETILKYLKDANLNKVKISIIHGGEVGKYRLERLLGDLRNISVYWHPKLHAKFYFNEKRMVVTSMNLTDLPQHDNIELGILLTRDQDGEIYGEVIREFLRIRKFSAKIKYRGYCIRCRKELKLNYVRPYCRDCYRIWAEYKNPNYLEKYCHECGEQVFLTLEPIPICRACQEGGVP